MRREQRCPQATTRGLTLVEVLLVVALLGLIAAALMGSWGEPSERVAFRALLQDVRNLDARARAAARTGKPVVLSVDPARRRLLVHARFGGEVVSDLELPEDAEVRVVRDNAVRGTSVAFAPYGTSCDYALDVQRGVARARVEFAGLTGWSSTVEVLP